VQADSDGVLRRYAFVHRGPDGLEPSLALAAYLSWREIDWSSATSFPEKQIVSWMELSADNSALETRQVSAVPAILNFRSAWDASGTASFRHYTRTQLQSLHSTRQTPDPQPSPLVNSILVVSLVSSGAGDVVTTPFGSNQPGAIIHSTALNDLIQGTSITRVPPPGRGRCALRHTASRLGNTLLPANDFAVCDVDLCNGRNHFFRRGSDAND
jgi:CHASE2 domain